MDGYGAAGAIYVLAVVAAVAWGLWEDRHARRRRRMYARLTAQFEGLATAFAGIMLPAVTAGEAAARFAAALREADDGT